MSDSAPSGGTGEKPGQEDWYRAELEKRAGEKPACETCGGAGEVGDHIPIPCPDCHGSGEKPVESGEGLSQEDRQQLRRIAFKHDNQPWRTIDHEDRAFLARLAGSDEEKERSESWNGN